MSQSTVATTVARRTPARRERASLQVVTPADRSGSPWFAVLCVALLLAGLAAVLGLNTSMAQDSFKVSALEARSASLADTEDSLAQSINAKSAPQNLATRADELGMVPAQSAAFIDVDQGKVLGVATVAEKPDGFTVGAAATSTADEADKSSTSTKKTADESMKKQSSTKSSSSTKD
ncbi:hypothetical protein ACWDHH_04885 [Janibacter hoylei]|uniref:Cell division protein FtsL n=1 Tax=Janibacter hoylei PVAS-1 TaxID=1210046 RepID=K1E0F1_9MICO|nr:hypothetical protein [Janibacter hoylei]EKA62154.1 hypothetical protein B277_03870 [Janibacter hoylei PVAS-1]RWU85121.1 hypothetical protein CWN80_02950 [Janibacter hoylei PVAS-1]